MDGNTADYSKDFPKGTLKGVKATYPGAELTSDFKDRLLKTDPKLKDFTYGPESYDATMLTALAAIAAKSDDPTTVRAATSSRSPRTARSARRFKECADLLKKGEDIDYQGVSGPCDLGETGSPTKATIGIFQYDADQQVQEPQVRHRRHLIHRSTAKGPDRQVGPLRAVGSAGDGARDGSVLAWPACRGRAR